MRFPNAMMIVGAAMAVLGVLMLIGRATLFITSRVWHGSSILALPLRFDLRQ
jgi:hypothetical protein